MCILYPFPLFLKGEVKYIFFVNLEIQSSTEVFTRYLTLLFLAPCILQVNLIFFRVQGLRSVVR